ncbi:MAG: isopentenyl-diphosphate Delta-isomerase [Pyrinomonadaceae bacterium]
MKYSSSNVFSYRQIVAVVAVLAFLATGAFFMANVVIPAEASWVSGINVILFAIPAFWACTKWLGQLNATTLFIVLGFLALAIETSAIATGFPYGHFAYSDLLGYRLFGYTPWTVFLAWTPLVIASYAVVRRLVDNTLIRIVLVALLLVAFDLVVDPGAVKLGFWRYEGGGVFYGVPMSNFVGWMCSGAIAAIVFEIFIYKRKPLLPVPVQLISSGFLIVFFWTAIALFSGMTVPMLLGFVILLGLCIFYVSRYYAFDDMIVMVDENDNPIGTARKLTAHDGDTKRHRAFSVFLFNDKGELLLQQRALTKKTWPGVWSNSCCGHVMLHESVENAARRRLKYELGIRVGELHLILPHFRYRAQKDGIVENEICPVLVGFTSTQPEPNPDEVNDLKWVNWKTFVSEVSDAANGYSPWAVEEVELLANEPRFEDFLTGQKIRN